MNRESWAWSYGNHVEYTRELAGTPVRMTDGAYGLIRNVFPNNQVAVVLPDGRGMQMRHLCALDGWQYQHEPLLGHEYISEHFAPIDGYDDYNEAIRWQQ